MFAKETIELAVKEQTKIEDQIKLLIPTKISLEQDINVQHKMVFTMVDGKICNSITGTTSSQRCYLCGATSMQFNDVDKMIGMAINPKTLEFGLSTLHAWIRFFECCLHVAYKLPIKKWQARSEAEKNVVDENKKNPIALQKRIRINSGQA